MTHQDRRLLRHLLAAVAVKMAVLAGLWWCFVDGARMPDDADRMPQRTAAHLAADAVTPGVNR